LPCGVGVVSTAAVTTDDICAPALRDAASGRPQEWRTAVRISTSITTGNTGLKNKSRDFI
jgi:hypothetical protein